MVRWKGLRRSSNVEDIRGAGGGGMPGGMRMPLRVGGGGGSILSIIIIGAILYFIGGPEMLMNMLGGGSVGSPTQTQTSPQFDPRSSNAAPTDEAGEFIAAMLGSTEDVWHQVFAAEGSQYVPPKLVRFDGAVQSACGYNTAATGPFYCPPDQKVYLDTSFFNELARMGGAGDFAQAYVIGHEVGHHIQTNTGLSQRVRQAQQNASETDSNQLQVRMELQADCYAGVWAHHANRTQQVLEPGDIEEGLAAAQAIGDDRLQRSAGRSVAPESFTHGSSQQRMEWLQRGLRSGDWKACDTFAQ